MKTIRKLIVLFLCVAMIGTLTACASTDSASSETDSPVTLNIAYQYGLAYAPIVICQENKLIEKAYSEITGKEVTVVWNQMSSGADINTGIAAGDIDVGFMGVGPAITGIAKNVGYKVFTNLSGQEHGLMTNAANINSLSDIIGSSNQIALVNIGSIQHIILAKALADNNLDPHALDSNIVAMKHPDGMSSLESNSIACHLTSNPYIYKERANSTLHELPEVAASWSKDNSFIVGVASKALNTDKPDLYKALCQAFGDAITFINSDIEATARITCEYDGNTYEDELNYLKAGSYTASTKGLLDLAKFMYENEFLTTELANYSDLVFENVTGD